jgi:glycosyltransferase involved in cell wall biosynthesis
MSGEGPVRVVHVFGTLNRGGAESVALDLCRSMPAGEFEQHFWLLGKEKGALADLFQLTGAVVSLCPLRPAVTFVPRLWHRLRVLRPNVMVAHVSVVSGLILLVSRSAGVPIRIAHMHSDGDARGNSLPRRWFRSAMRWLIKHNATDVVGVTSGSIAFAGGDPRYRVLPNGIDFARYAGVRVTENDVPSDPAGNAGPVLMHIGRAAPEKNRAFLLPVHDAANRIAPGTRLVLVGPGGSDDLGPAAAERPGVELVGETREVEKYLARADALLLPSHWEGLPGVVLQALAAGVPVVANDMPSTRDIAAKYPGMTVLPTAAGPEAWAVEALRAAALPRQERRSIAAAMCASEYQLDRYAQAWRALWTSRA